MPHGGMILHGHKGRAAQRLVPSPRPARRSRAPLAISPPPHRRPVCKPRLPLGRFSLACRGFGLGGLRWRGGFHAGDLAQRSRQDFALCGQPECVRIAHRRPCIAPHVIGELANLLFHVLHLHILLQCRKRCRNAVNKSRTMQRCVDERPRRGAERFGLQGSTARACTRWCGEIMPRARRPPARPVLLGSRFVWLQPLRLAPFAADTRGE